MILTGGIDLSVGSILAMSTVLTALTLQAGMPTGVSVLFVLASCGIAGLVNGILVVWLNIPPFIATLAMMSAVKGFSYIIQSTSLIEIRDQSFIQAFSRGTFLGMRNPVLIFIIVAVVAALVAKYTTFGRSLYAIGGNPEASRLSGSARRPEPDHHLHHLRSARGPGRPGRSGPAAAGQFPHRRRL